MAQGQCSGYPDIPCRVNMDLLPESTLYFVWLFTALALGVFAYGVWQMISVWRLGTSWTPGNWKAGAKRLIVALATHKKFRPDDKKESSGRSHRWMFYGFAVLFVGTVLAAIDQDFYELILKDKLLEGTGYLVYEAVLDFFGLLFVLGVGYLAARRWSKNRPKHLHPSKNVEAPWLQRMDGDTMALVFLLLIGVTGFIMEAIRLRHQIEVDGITYAQWSFVGNALATLMGSVPLDVLETSYGGLWWFHFFLWSSILAVLPWTKFKHIITSSLNIYFHDPEREARAALSKPFDLQEIMESGDMDAMGTVGYSTIRDFTWKDRLALDACTNCGRCEAQCPASAAGRPLSPRKLIQDLKEHMWEDYRAEKAHMKSNAEGDYAPVALTKDNALEVAIDEATLWSCTTCRACMTECPVDIPHVDIIAEMRRGLVMESRLDEHQGKLIMNLTNAKNPYGFPMADRADWTNGLEDGIEVPVASAKAAAGESFEYLWWVGCVGSYDPRNQDVTRSVAKILNAAEVDFAILGTEEACNGDPARRLGEEGLFQQAVMENMMVLEQYGVKKIIAQCPHCFNTFANEYPEFGAKFEVIHHTQLIEQLIADGKVPLRDGKQMSVTYHDSCYLGRHNDIFDAPRRVLEQANGLPVLEMAQSGDQGLCCGAGGSNMWYEVEQEETRINVIRAKQAAETGADTVATACPFCLTMMKDGLSLTGNSVDDGGTMVAQDLAEIVAARLAWTPAGPPVELDGSDQEE